LNIEIAWIRKDGCLTHIGDNVEQLTGWTAEETMAQPISSLVTPSTLTYIKKHYYTGPPNSIVPRLFPIGLLHRDGHVIYCRVAVICRYDGNRDLTEAWGCLQCHQNQCVQNKVLAWWSRAQPMEFEILEHVVKVCA